MDSPKDEPKVVRATEYFRDVERELKDLGSLYLKVCQGTKSLGEEFRGTVKKSVLILYPRYRDGNPWPTGIHWARICRPRPRIVESPLPGSRPRRTWVKYLRHGPTHDQLFGLVRDVGSKAVVDDFTRRADALNQACRKLTRARQSLEKRLVSRRARRSWEPGDLPYPAPQVALDLPDTSKGALGAAWRILLRMGATEIEMAAFADRFNAAAPYRDLRLLFERDAAHRYGRYVWTLRGIRRHGVARTLARNKGRIKDGANFTDRVMRKLGIPAAARLAIRGYETERRRIAGHHRYYTSLMGRLRKRAGEALAAAWRLLRRGSPGEAVAS